MVDFPASHVSFQGGLPGYLAILKGCCLYWLPGCGPNRWWQISMPKWWNNNSTLPLPWLSCGACKNGQLQSTQRQDDETSSSATFLDFKVPDVAYVSSTRAWKTVECQPSSSTQKTFNRSCASSQIHFDLGDYVMIVCCFSAAGLKYCLFLNSSLQEEFQFD